MIQRKKSALIAAAVVGGVGGTVMAAPFTPGDLVVFQVTGTATLTSAATPDYLAEYTVAGTLVQTILMPTTSSGTATSEGELTLGPTGYLAVPGYNTPAGTSSVASTTSSATANQRSINIVDANGVVDSTTELSSAYSGNNIRSATYDGTSIYTAGTSSTAGAAGIQYAAPGATTSTQIESTVSNTRVVQEVGGNVYFSTSAGTETGTAGIYEVAGTPSTSGQTATLVAGDTSSAASPYGFYFTSLNGVGAPAGINTLYVADSTTGGSAPAGIILKYSLVGSTWTLNGSVAIPGATGSSVDEIAGLAGITASAGVVGVGGGAVDLYSASPTNLYAYVDTAGYDAAPSTTAPVSIATAPTDAAFRGVALVPTAVPEPATLGLASLAMSSLLVRRRRR